MASSTRPGTARCERCHDELAVICPMCGLGRTAMVDTCTNCGLVLKVKPRAVVVRRAGVRPEARRRGGRLRPRIDDADTATALRNP